jgi:glycosyltransferase involved in cell wall biosynthesis
MKERSETSRLPQVALIGAYPPPIGGNTLHISRLHRLLKTQGYRVQVLDYMGQGLSTDSPDVKRLSGNVWLKARQVLRFMRGIPRGSIVHFHVSTLLSFQWVAPALILATIGCKRVITIHSGRFVENWWTPFHRMILRMLFSRFSSLIAVSKEIKNALLTVGVQPNRVFVIPAYMKESVQFEHLPESFKEIPQEKIKIVTSGQLIHIYNYEILAESISHIDPEKFHVIFAFYGARDTQYETKIINPLNEYPNITIYQDLSPQAFLAVLDSSDIYVRTTLRDGDSVAVREALTLGNKVYATDCVQRPSGCVVFKNSKDLIEQLRGWHDEQHTKTNPTFDGFQQIRELYEALNGGLINAASSR